ncbi:helix-turn-helix domain-containing protein [Exiguobacterium sp. s22]|uniref:helix-turn-helix domain-containing protein n=1 Tax=Exiguobacterium sp. s22 TaxID=2751272 RepID=UPI001BEB7D9F|nr:helix-turn-helix domain-containing protein [Exiguobacterium sp. s22]
MYKNEKEVPLVLSTDDVAKIMNIGKSAAYDLMKSKEFYIVQVGKQFRVSREIFFNWLNGKEAA